jgi:hypothetical protein
MRCSSAFATVASEAVRRRFLREVFFPSLWLAFARLRRIFPVEVTRNRLADPLCDFIFGMASLPRLW